MGAMFMAVVALGGIGLLLGLGLTFAEKKFKVIEDPRLTALLDVLPSVNCGACGYPGCGNFASALLSGEAAPSDCPVGGNATTQAIAGVLGITVKETVPLSAFIRCAGGESNSNFRYEYHGMNNCNAVMQLAAGGPKSCSYGCLGGGSCIASCDFDAIVIEDGIAKVDNEKCVSCGLCVPACPKNLIEMVPKASKTRVACNASEEARAIRANCKVGCINCKLCEKACDYAAVHVYHLLAEVEYDKCTDCGECVEKCPTKCIVVIER